MEGRGRPGRNGPLDGNGRRSIYIEVRRNFLSPLMRTFDTPQPFSTVGRRNQSNVPAQALILLNDPFVRQQTDLWLNNRNHSQRSQSGLSSFISKRSVAIPPSQKKDERSHFYKH